ncbi:response regulator [Clostridiaceae bacterium 35-E11]
MDRSVSVEALMEKSKRLFLQEQKEKLYRAIGDLMTYRLYKNQDDVINIGRFFHSLKGTGATLGFQRLAELGTFYEDYIDEKIQQQDFSEKFILNLFQGFSEIYDELKKFYAMYEDKAEKVEGSIDTKEQWNGEKVSNEKAAKKERILLVDDANVIIQMIKTRWTEMGYEVAYADDGEEGLQLSQLLKPDLMIVDLMLPKLDGFEIIRQVKKNPETQNTKIIVLSSKKKEEDILRCFDLGADDYMIKPFSLKELEQRAKRLLYR